MRGVASECFALLHAFVSCTGAGGDRGGMRIRRVLSPPRLSGIIFLAFNFIREIWWDGTQDSEQIREC
jgi:hypothetical protein